MLGTIVNASAIIVGTVIGSLLHRGVKEKYKDVLYTGLGLASLAIGLNATICHFGQSEYPVLFIISLAVGGVVGTALDIDGRIGNGYTLGGRQFIERFHVGLFVPMHFVAGGFESAWRMKEFTDERHIPFWAIGREGETLETTFYEI